MRPAGVVGRAAPVAVVGLHRLAHGDQQATAGTRLPDRLVTVGHERPVDQPVPVATPARSATLRRSALTLPKALATGFTHPTWHRQLLQRVAVSRTWAERRFRGAGKTRVRAQPVGGYPLRVSLRSRPVRVAGRLGLFGRDADDPGRPHGGRDLRFVAVAGR